jgi:hypothetical protein
MERDKIIKGVKKAIVTVSNVDTDNIKQTDKIKAYVPVIDGPNLAGEINSIFSKVKMTPLLNNLFDPISKVSDLVDYINDIYEK